MEQQDLTPIPIPPRQRWREFRVAYLPPLTFLTLVGVICWMWMNYVRPSAIIGEVETIHANIVSTVAGTVVDLRVDQLQSVTNGQIVAVIERLDADQLRAELGAAEADLRVMKARMDLDKTRNLDSYSRLRVALLEENLLLDVARIRLRQAQQELERAERLLAGQIISRGTTLKLDSSRNDFGYEVTLRDRDSLQSEIAAREKTAGELEAQLKNVEQTGLVRVEPSDASIEEAIRAERERIEQLEKPLVLRSPIDGFVSEIACRTGEKISAGGTILVVGSHKSDRIVAWVHPPVLEKPQVGDVVLVNRMGMGQASFEGMVVRVGSQLEPVSPLLRTPTVNPERIEVGLPLLVQASAALELIPGEAVQMRVVRPARRPVAN